MGPVESYPQDLVIQTRQKESPPSSTRPQHLKLTNAGVENYTFLGMMQNPVVRGEGDLTF